jgi:hypothetical protein
MLQAGRPAVRLKLIVVLSLHASRGHRTAPGRRVGNAPEIGPGGFVDIRFERHIDPVDRPLAGAINIRRPARAGNTPDAPAPRHSRPARWPRLPGSREFEKAWLDG